ncbi:MAG: lipid-binding SYLF domain-containing protein [Acidobacteriota bacterium]
MKKTLVASLALFCLHSFTLLSSTKDQEKRLTKSTQVLKEILDVPDGIPQSLLDKAECVVVVPSVKKFAIGFGGSYGRGAMLCRSGKDFRGKWGAPSMTRLEGGSFGLQLGGSATDFVLLVMNERGANGLLSSKVKLGADATAAAGPKGRSSEAATDASLRAEILSYSRSRGLIAGISLKGSTLRPDKGGNKDLYGRKVSAREIVLEGKVTIPDSCRPLITLLQQRSPKNKSD